MRSNLGKVRGMGSAKDGTGHFLNQRLTAVSNIPCIIFFIAFFIMYGSSPIDEISSVISNPIVSSIMVIGVISIFIHMQLGMCVIIEDYVHSHFLKILFLLLNSFFVFSSAILCLVSILKIAIVSNL